MKNHERWSIVMFIVIFLFAVFEFIYLPDGMGIRLLDGVRHYCRIKPYEIIVPVIISSYGAGLVHHGTWRRGLVIFFIGIAVFIGTLLYTA
ncbi:MAG TPA: hypothetical protein IAC33_09430 [Candidatus Fimousia stercorigallinarum]|nr:hypothetical protein [Candidatus Fimousia stercorigallinarum]